MVVKHGGRSMMRRPIQHFWGEGLLIYKILADKMTLRTEDFTNDMITKILSESENCSLTQVCCQKMNLLTFEIWSLKTQWTSFQTFPISWHVCLPYLYIFPLCSRKKQPLHQNMSPTKCVSTPAAGSCFCEACSIFQVHPSFYLFSAHATK